MSYEKLQTPAPHIDGIDMTTQGHSGSPRTHRGRTGARRECGLRLRVHDLKHTFGRRLRAAGVAYETRQVLLGHSTGDITIHYSPAEIQELIDAVEKLTVTPATVLREIPRRFTQISRT